MEAEADVTPTSLRPIKWTSHAGLALLFFPCRDPPWKGDLQ